jgi:hypothetical protein
MALLVRTLTNNTAAGACRESSRVPASSHRSLPHLQLQQTQCLPFAFWAFHWLLSTGRVRDGALFGLFAAGQLLSCVLTAFSWSYIAVVCGTMLLAERRC